MRTRTIVAAAGLTAGLLAALPAHAAGSAFGTGAAGSGCGGSILLAAGNSSGNNWVFDVTVTCTGAPQHVVIAGQWDAGTGGPVVGFGNGSLNLGRVNCGANGSVPIQIAMVGSPLRSGTASITRIC